MAAWFPSTPIGHKCVLSLFVALNVFFCLKLAWIMEGTTRNANEQHGSAAMLLKPQVAQAAVLKLSHKWLGFTKRQVSPMLQWQFVIA
jgi:hypothetical protein